MKAISVDESGAFVERFSLPPTGDGPLAGLRFGVKDIIDIAGRRTGCGNPTWLETHPPAAASAVCVEQLLAAGAGCDGKTITDEIAFSILGENHFYGTPLNPTAPERVPGGSSSGSASAVACELVDFALGTDTGGSVRIPASNCGIWGWRPTHGVISVAGVMPLSPSFDTVGVFARSSEVLRRATGVLVASMSPSDAMPATIHLVVEAFELADADVRSALARPLQCLRGVFGAGVREASLGELCGDARMSDLATWLEIYRALFGLELASCLGGWIAAERPAVGPLTAAGIEFVNSLDRAQAGEAIRRREHYYRKLSQILRPRDLLCMPTVPRIAPQKGTIRDRNSDYHRRTGSLNSIAGIGRLPQVSMPLATATSAPIGLSLIGARYEDMFLLEVANVIDKSWSAK